MEENDVYTGHALSSLLEVSAHAGSNDQNVQSEVEAAVEDADEVVREIVDGDPIPAHGRVKVRREAKAWLDVEGNVKDKDLALKMKPILQLAGDNVSDVLFGLNTCLSECSNIRRLVFCRKDRFYYQTYEVRSLLSAVMENVGRNYLWQRIYAYFGLEWDAKDERVDQFFERKDEKREKHSDRKKSRKYSTRQAEISKSRIAENIAAGEESKKRMANRGYKTLASKRLKPGAFERRRGPMSQEELKAAHERGEKVTHCGQCGKYYKKTHNQCRPNKGQTRVKRKQQGQKRPRPQKQQEPGPAPPPSPVINRPQRRAVQFESDGADEESSSIADRIRTRGPRRRIDADVDWDDDDGENVSSYSMSDYVDE